MESNTMNISERFLVVSLGLFEYNSDATIFLISLVGHADKFNKVELTNSFFREFNLSKQRTNDLKDLVGILVLNKILKKVGDNTYQINKQFNSNDFLDTLSDKELEKLNIFSEELPNTFKDEEGYVIFSLDGMSDNLEDLI